MTFRSGGRRRRRGRARSTCDCGAEVVWTVTEANEAKMPCDPAAVPNGNLVLYRRADGDLGSRVKKPSDPPPFYVSHFATCPDKNPRPRAGEVTE